MNRQEIKNHVLLHNSKIRDLVRDFTEELKSRVFVHDLTKLESPEIDMLENFTFKHEKYGTEEYEKMRKSIEPFLKTHAKINSHHPEHYEKGLDDMDLYDLCEMFFDWRAASERYGENIWDSIEIGKEKFKMSDQLYHILKNTADRTWKK